MYPMHSVGMTAELWRKLFPIEGKGIDGVVSHITTYIDHFLSQRKTKQVKHGQAGWFMDQLLLGCTIDAAAATNGYTVEVDDRPLQRLDIMGNATKNITDVHLATFRLSEHGPWLTKILQQTGALSGYHEKYEQYTKLWMDRTDVN